MRVLRILHKALQSSEPLSQRNTHTGKAALSPSYCYPALSIDTTTAVRSYKRGKINKNQRDTQSNCILLKGIIIFVLAGFQNNFFISFDTIFRKDYKGSDR